MDLSIKDKKIGLCLSGGGARGFAHLGVLAAFDELEIPIAKLSGSSAGAFAAALYAEGHKPYEILEVIQRRKFWKYASFRPTKFGFMNLNKTARILKELIPHNSFEGLKIHTAICATNISRGVPEYFEEGELINPIIASATVPVLFKPVLIKGSRYLDGGLSNILPIEPLLSCDLKIAVNVTPFHPRLPVKSIKDIILKSVYISVDHQSRERYNMADIVIEPKGIIHFDGFKMKHAEKLYQIGYESTKEVLQGII